MRYLLPTSLVFFICLFMANSNSVFSQDKGKTQEVVGEGVGTSADLALKDAFRNAVRQVVGAYVDAETLVKNDELVEDKILTYSNGFIKTFSEVEGSKKVQGGIYRVKIKAVVETGSVIAKLNASNISIKEVDGKGLFAEVVSKMDLEKDAAALLKKSFEGFPNSIMSFSVEGKPNVLDKNEKFAAVEIPIKIEVNMDSFKAYVKKMDIMLSKIAVLTKEFQIDLIARKNGYVILNRNGDFSRNYNQDLLKTDFFANRLERKIQYANLEPYHSELIGNLKNNKIKGKGFHVLILNTHQNVSCTEFKFKYFVLNNVLPDKFIETYFSQKKTANLKLAFLNGEKEVIADKEFLVPTVVQFKKRSEFTYGDLKFSYDALLLTPLFLVDSYQMYFSSNLSAKPKIEIGLDDLQKVKDVKIEAISK